MISFFSFIFFLYLIFKNFSSLFGYLYLWQLKEYRPDRLLAHLKTKEGRRQILINFNFALVRELRRPKLTLKIVLLLSLSLVLSFHFFFVFWQLFFDFLRYQDRRLILSSLLALISLNIFSFFLVSFLVLLLSPLVFLMKKFLSLLAKIKLSQFGNLIVIGVTGSYGKTSTKDFLAALLSSQYSVLKTEKTRNTEIAISQTILFQLKKTHQVFIVEMGAYKKGEIAAICQLVKPQIGILTGINEQHQSLFGSLKNTIMAKNELIESLPADGLAVFNADNPFCFQLAKESKVAKRLYSSQEKSDIYAGNIKIEKSKLSFNLRIKEQKQKIILKLYGQQNVSNFLAAAAVADYLKIPLEEIASLAKKIRPTLGTMFLIKKRELLAILDDSFSSNPHGFNNALDYLAIYPQEKKIVITPGIIELGSSAKRIHQKLGEKIGLNADYLILTNDNYLKPLFAGALKSGMKKDQLILERNPHRLIKILEKLADKNTIILIEGRIAEKTKSLIISNN